MKFRNVSRLTARAAAAALALAVLCARAQAAAPQLPASAIVADTYAVILVDIAKVDPASVQASANALLGAQAAMATEPLAKYKAKYDEFTGIGAATVTIVVGGEMDGPKPPEPVVYVSLKPGSDVAAAEAKVRELQAKEGKGDQMEVTHDGDFLVLHSKGSELPKEGAADRAKSFTDLIGSGDKAVSIAFIPTDKIRAKMKANIKNDPNQPPYAAALGTNLSDSKSLVIDLKLGDAPTIGMTVDAADDAGAKGISDAITAAGTDLKTKAAQMKAGGEQFAPMADAMTSLADALKPAAAGSKVSLSLEGKIIAPAVANLLPFIMGAAGGAPPK